MFEGFEIIIRENLLELLKPKPLATVIALLLLAVIFAAVRKKGLFNTRILTYGAVSIALSFVLSYVRLVRLPNGGSVTVASMLPLFIFSYIAGPAAGMAVGLCYGMLQYIQEPFFVHWVQFLLDYPIAFAMLGLAGFFKDKPVVGAIAGSMGRLACHFLSGVVFFAQYAGDKNVLWYSLSYNASYILPEAVICMIMLVLLRGKSFMANITRGFTK